MSGFQLQRLGTLMVPEPGNPNEVEGVLNPAAARGPDGNLYLFPRLVAKGNFSRIGIAKVQFSDAGDPCGVERLGVALEPETNYELRPDGTGGCEDPRVSYVSELQHYTMTYTALTSRGPRIALAVSEDLFHWQRVGLASFEPFAGIEFGDVDNKDSCVLPVAVPDPAGKAALALLNRPLFPGTRPEEKAVCYGADEPDIHLESIWISYRDLNIQSGELYNLSHFTSHHRLAYPVAPWEKLKIGMGTPPILTKHGWMMIYHGVCDISDPTKPGFHLRYSAGVMILDKDDPCKILYRSPQPILVPELPEEQIGMISNVVFPTGIDCRIDIGQPDRFDVYYGMADDRIGVARLDLPEHLPATTELTKRIATAGLAQS